MSGIGTVHSNQIAPLRRGVGTGRLPADLLLLAATLTLDLLIWGGHNQTRLNLTVPPGAVVVSGVAAFGLLLLRRFRPWVAYTAVWCYTVLWAALLPSYQPVMGLLIVLYSIARRESIRATLTALAALSVPWTIDIYNAGAKIGFTLTNLLTVSALWCSFAAAVTVAGRIGHRAQRLTELREAMQATEAVLAVQQEQLRLARELHDIVAHSVSAIMFTAAALRTHSAAADPSLDRGLSIIEQTSTSAMRELGQLLGVLRADRAHQRSSPGVEDLAELMEATRGGGVVVVWNETGVRVHDPEIGHVVYRVVQEALANVMKHGGDGAQAIVELAWGPDRVNITVTNDVCSAASRGHSTGLGLQGLRERLDAVGGQLQAELIDDGRFRVTVDLPNGSAGATLT